MIGRRIGALGVVALCLSTIGCDSSDQIDTTYGRTRGESINGTGAFAEILRSRGHEVRSAVLQTKRLADWADVVIRFAPRPGPIDQQDAKWLTDWLNARPGRQLIYIPRDFDAESEFWQAVLDAQPKGTDPTRILALEKSRNRAGYWYNSLPRPTKEPAEAASWFEFADKPLVPKRCQTLQGSWSIGVDAPAAAITRHEAFKVMGGEEILLAGDDEPLAIAWNFANGSRVAVIANASFLLNASLLNQARRPLTLRVVDWIGADNRHVAFLEGHSETGTQQSQSRSQVGLPEEERFHWLAFHFGVFLFLLAFSLATRLGRPIAEAVADVGRPAAHAEALGALLAKTGRSDVARFLLENYRRWRNPSPKAGRSAPTSPPPR